ncbi:Ase1p KNAG_0L01820 [Huiozyma naganishii CBS 8797]|uniref:Uncharacterized protein n=1 Tax=Huiozyma naganishii (strain ATCC MYA-139 / BCRC 22969 / CBS 8797 / KCTC 17520 / NBRC 10181 / NCYC 3082 / Yp74L-3) TaxID=1071383 RepID=J7SB71_HUIN7|nr:hypothetical protein KNAG_0L01820 [Kazachstania naganishii CBS 8797]CCK72801.1 hypothetical protein KNAG_0L01820 [Kazachstania naganishii CBS 8797]
MPSRSASSAGRCRSVLVPVPRRTLLEELKITGNGNTSTTKITKWSEYTQNLKNKQHRDGGLFVGWASRWVYCSQLVNFVVSVSLCVLGGFFVIKKKLENEGSETKHQCKCVNIYMAEQRENSTQTTTCSFSNTSDGMLTQETQPIEESPTKGFFALTPVRIRGLESPLRRSSIGDDGDGNGIGFGNRPSGGSSSSALRGMRGSESPLRIESPRVAQYRDKFTMISQDLERLLENLHVVYHKIGYTYAEIKGKEKTIFNKLSGSITEFYSSAEEEMNNLILENDVTQDILNRMLEKLQDPSGLSTIPDVYVRNAILYPKSKTVPDSPKKPLPLIEVQNSMNTAKKFVFKEYLPQLLNFIDHNIALQRMIHSVGEILIDLTEEDKLLAGGLPSLKSSEALRNILASQLNGREFNVEFLLGVFKKHKKLLLYDTEFSDISSERVKQMDRIASIYQQEYGFRCQRIRSLVNECDALVKKLGIPEDDISEKADLRQFIAKIDGNPRGGATADLIPVSNSTLEFLSNALSKYQRCESERQAEKTALLHSCETLWTLLKVPQGKIDSFQQQHSGLSLETLSNMKNELKNLQVMKKSLIKNIINESWGKINELWDTLQADSQDRAPFLRQFETLRNSSKTLEDDERLLEVCEEELKRLDARLAVYTPVLKLIEEFKSLKEDKLFLENSSKDSSRLLSRNSHKILLREEKTRKRILRHFPRVIRCMKLALERAEQVFHIPFTVDDQDIHEVIEQEEEQFRSNYPRSVLSLGTGTARRSQTTGTQRVAKPKTPQIKTPQLNSVRGVSGTLLGQESREHMQRTPVARVVHPKTPSNRVGLPSTDRRSKSLETRRSVPRQMSGTRSVKTQRSQTGLLPPTAITGRQAAEERKPASTVAPSHLPTSPRLRGIRPTRLFPLDMNTMHNRRSQIPVLFKSKSAIDFDTAAKSTRNSEPTLRVHNGGNTLSTPRLSSPYKEPEHCVYQVSMSPEGKLQLNVESEFRGKSKGKDSYDGENHHAGAVLDTQFDDTSILDDDEADPKFVQWKTEQLAKLDQLQHMRAADAQVTLEQHG